MREFSLLKTVCIVLVFCAAAVIAAPAQNVFFTTLANFGAAPTYGAGAGSFSSLIQASDGDFYGTSYYGGASKSCPIPYGCGTVFKVTAAGTLATLHRFSGGVDGALPSARLVQATDGNFYGTTSGGGTYGYGVVFKITPAGTLTILHSFDDNDGAQPSAGLVQAADGNFYGTTPYDAIHGGGTVFKITPSGALTTLHSFDDNDGWQPYAGLIQTADGNFYGTTIGGGTYYYGTVFEITPGGALTTLHSFDGTDGYQPWAALVQATDGSFYGTTAHGGGSDNCYYGGVAGCGTVFKITPSGTLTTLHSFDGGDGEEPSGLVQATDGNFYGTTPFGGANDDGTVFKITPAGTLTTLHSFDSWGGTGAGLVQATDGRFYGATTAGGALNDGTVFSLLAPR